MTSYFSMMTVIKLLIINIKRFFSQVLLLHISKIPKVTFPNFISFWDEYDSYWLNVVIHVHDMYASLIESNKKLINLKLYLN